MANVGYADINTQDAATLLGTTKWNVQNWCRWGYIKYINVGEGTQRPRYMFTEDEIDRVDKLIKKYGKRGWFNHVKDELNKTNQSKPEETVTKVADPETYIPDDTDEITGYIKKIRALKVQRDKLLAELDNIDEAIKTMRQKVIDSI